MENEIQPREKGIRTGRVIALSAGHLVNDMYMNQLQVMIPYLVLAGISLSRGAFLVSLFTITSSLVQPVFGYYSDRKSNAWMIFTGTLWMAVLLGIIGLIPDYRLMMPVAMLAGLGTAAFHPQASALVATCSQTKKTFVQAIFIASGNVGWALTPLLAVPLMDRHGIAATPLFIIPGVIISLILWLYSRNLPLPEKRRKSSDFFPLILQHFPELFNIMIIVALRSLTYFSFISFLPLYLQQKGIPLTSGSRMVFLLLFTGSIGGLIGGFLADQYGRRLITIVSLCAASPLFVMFLLTSGLTSIVFLALAGAFLLATFSVTVTMAHSVIKNNAGLASGLMLGFGTGIGGLGVGLMGLLADHAGIKMVVDILVWLPLAAGLYSFSLKKN